MAKNDGSFANEVNPLVDKSDLLEEKIGNCG